MICKLNAYIYLSFIQVLYLTVWTAETEVVQMLVW